MVFEFHFRIILGHCKNSSFDRAWSHCPTLLLCVKDSRSRKVKWLGPGQPATWQQREGRKPGLLTGGSVVSSQHLTSHSDTAALLQLECLFGDTVLRDICQGRNWEEGCFLPFFCSRSTIFFHFFPLVMPTWTVSHLLQYKRWGDSSRRMGFYFRLMVGVFISCSFCNKLLWTGWLKTIEICSLTVV